MDSSSPPQGRSPFGEGSGEPPKAGEAPGSAPPRRRAHLNFRTFLVIEAALLVALALWIRPWEGRGPLRHGVGGEPAAPGEASGGRLILPPPPLPASLMLVDGDDAPYPEATAALGSCAGGDGAAIPLVRGPDGAFPLPVERWSAEGEDDDAPTPHPLEADCLFMGVPGPITLPPHPLGPHRGEAIVRLALPRAPRMTAEVVDTRGRSLDAVITLEQSRGAEVAEAVVVQAEGGAASFYLDPVFPSIILRFSAPGHLDEERSLDTRQGPPPRELRVSLSPIDAVVEVRCQEEGGGPCDREVTRLRCEAGEVIGPTATVDGEGHGAVSCPPGDGHRLFAWRITGGGVGADLAPEQLEAEVELPAQDGVVAGSVRDERLGAELREFELEWRWAPAVEPEVVLSGGRSVADRQGRFEVQGLAPGLWVVAARAPGFGPVAAGPVAVEGGGITVLAPLVAPREATLEGTVLLEGGLAAPGATVLALYTGEGPLARILPPAEPSAAGKGAAASPRIAGEAQANALGRFTLGGLAPGVYQVVAYAFERPPLAGAERVRVQVEAGQRRLNVEVPLSSR